MPSLDKESARQSLPSPTFSGAYEKKGHGKILRPHRHRRRGRCGPGPLRPLYTYWMHPLHTSKQVPSSALRSTRPRASGQAPSSVLPANLSSRQQASTAAPRCQLILAPAGPPSTFLRSAAGCPAPTAPDTVDCCVNGCTLGSIPRAFRPAANSSSRQRVSTIVCHAADLSSCQRASTIVSPAADSSSRQRASTVVRPAADSSSRQRASTVVRPAADSSSGQRASTVVRSVTGRSRERALLSEPPLTRRRASQWA